MQAHITITIHLNSEEELVKLLPAFKAIDVEPEVSIHVADKNELPPKPLTEGIFNWKSSI
jgi:hypothetical protein